MSEKIKCPYCGEEISAEAKKCRFCGEWLTGDGDVQVPVSKVNNTVVPSAPAPTIIINNSNENTQNMNVVNEAVAEDSDGGSNWVLWLQALAVGGLVWGLTATFWWGLGAMIILFILLSIPVIGHIVGAVMGIGIGVLVGFICKELGAPTAVQWIVGGILGFGLMGYNFEYTDKEKE